MPMTGEKFIDVDGVQIRYFEKGAGPIVVLFHGGHFRSHDAADCAEDWTLNFDALAECFHVYAVGHALFDLIARGTPNSRMYIFNRAGHFSYREHPPEFNAMLGGFIQRMA